MRLFKSFSTVALVASVSFFYTALPSYATVAEFAALGTAEGFTAPLDPETLGIAGLVVGAGVLAVYDSKGITAGVQWAGSQAQAAYNWVASQASGFWSGLSVVNSNLTGTLTSAQLSAISSEIAKLQFSSSSTYNVGSSSLPSAYPASNFLSTTPYTPTYDFINPLSLLMYFPSGNGGNISLLFTAPTFPSGVSSITLYYLSNLNGGSMSVVPIPMYPSSSGITDEYLSVVTPSSTGSISASLASDAVLAYTNGTYARVSLSSLGCAVTGFTLSNNGTGTIYSNSGTGVSPSISWYPSIPSSVDIPVSNTNSVPLVIPTDNNLPVGVSDTGFSWDGSVEYPWGNTSSVPIPTSISGTIASAPAVPSTASASSSPTVSWPSGNSLNWKPLEMVGVDFTNKFPFSLPWDVSRLFTSLSLSSVSAPSISATWVPYSGLSLPVNIVFPSWMLSAVPYFRDGLFIAFNAGLLLATRKLLGGDV